MRLRGLQWQSQQRRRRGLSLIEMLVSCALISVIGLFVLQLYLSAQTEFEHTTGTVSMSQHARKITSKLLPLLASAIPTTLDSNGILVPPGGVSANAEFYECDFLCSKYVIRFPDPTSQPGWDGNTQTWRDPTFSDRLIYEYDTVNVSPDNRREPSIYRYRVLWRPYSDNTYTQFPKRAVVFQRLRTDLFGTNQTNAPLQGNTSIPNPNKQAIPGTAFTVVAPKVSMLTFQRDGSALQLRIRIYNVDPDVWKDAVAADSVAMRYEAALDGSFMRGLNRQVRFRAYDVTTSIHLPASTIR